MELVEQMREYQAAAEEPTLAGFLEQVALVSDVDGFDPEKGAVALMTPPPTRRVGKTRQLGAGGGVLQHGLWARCLGDGGQLGPKLGQLVDRHFAAIEMRQPGLQGG